MREGGESATAINAKCHFMQGTHFPFRNVSNENHLHHVPALDLRVDLPGQQAHASGDEHCGDPPAAIDFFVEEDFGGEGIADEGE